MSIEPSPPLIHRKGHDSVSNGKPSVIEKMTSFDETVLSDDGARSMHKKKKKKPAWYRRMEESFCDFAEHTSSHGIPRAYTAPNSVKRALWMILFFLCLGAFCFQATLIIKRFLRNDIIVGVELKFENIPFPSVTVCNLNPYKNSLARSMASVRDTLLAFDTAIENSNPSGQSRRRKRAIPSVLEPSLVASKCAIATDTGMYFAVSEEPDFNEALLNHVDCYCLHSRRHERNYECAPTEAWEAAECHCNTGNGICERFAVNESGEVGGGTIDKVVPCSCRGTTSWSGELCVANEFDQLQPSWPLRFSRHRCQCQTQHSDAPCMPNKNGTTFCLCASPENSETLYCARESAWTRHQCSDCNWHSECQKSYVIGSASDKEQQCLCHGNKCLAVTAHEPTMAVENMENTAQSSKPKAISSTDGSVRVRRQVQRVYESIYNRFDGLLAVYSVCECEDGMCQAHKNAVNGSICLCFFNRKNGQIWPCYPPDFWSERRCPHCSPLGDCTFAETEGKFPCVCAAIIR